MHHQDTTRTLDPQIITDLEGEFSSFRSRIADLSGESLALATDLFALLAPLQLKVLGNVDAELASLAAGVEKCRVLRALPTIDVRESAVTPAADAQPLVSISAPDSTTTPRIVGELELAGVAVA